MLAQLPSPSWPACASKCVARVIAAECLGRHRSGRRATPDALEVRSHRVALRDLDQSLASQPSGVGLAYLPDECRRRGADGDHQAPRRWARDVSVCGAPRGRVARVPGPPTPVASPAGQRHLALEDLDQLVPRVTVERRRLRVRAHVLDHRDRVIPDRVESHQDAVAACAGEGVAAPRGIDAGPEPVPQ